MPGQPGAEQPLHDAVVQVDGDAVALVEEASHRPCLRTASSWRALSITRWKGAPARAPDGLRHAVEAIGVRERDEGL